MRTAHRLAPYLGRRDLEVAGGDCPPREAPGLALSAWTAALPSPDGETLQGATL
jgi:hypothetical protein